MRNKLVVAVIDSGIDCQDEAFQDIEYEDYYYEEGRFQKNYAGELNYHGTDVIKVVLKEISNIRIISIKVLKKNNACSLSDMIAALNYSIELDADVINMSLGSCTAKSARITQLKEACEHAAQKGIAVFAADHNNLNEKAYPANFQCVAGVTSTDEAHPYCSISYEDRIIQFSEAYVYIPDDGRTIIRQGNSFLCPLIVGMYCRFIENRARKQLWITEFLDFFQEAVKRKLIDHIFFNRYDAADKNSFCGKKVLYFADDDFDINNIKLFDMYSEVCDLTRCFADIYQRTDQEILDRVKGADLFFVGALSSRFINHNKWFMEHLSQLLLNSDIKIVTVYPYLNTHERIELVKDGFGDFKSIYK